MNIKRILCGGLVVLLLFVTAGAQASNVELEEAQKEYKELSEELNLLNQQLMTLSDDLNDLESEMAASEKEIARLNEETARLEEEKKQQYEDMKLRIQYTYENSNNNLLAVLLESKSLADFVNRAEYFATITRYDRNMVKHYESLIVTIEDNKASVLAQMERQEQLAEEIQDKQEQILSAILRTQQSLADSQNEIDAYIAKIEAQEAANAADTGESSVSEGNSGNQGDESWEGSGSEESGSGEENGGNEGNTGGSDYEESDLLLLGALIECEAVGEPYEGKLAVGSVVLNRVHSEKFPDTIVGVIYQPGQFSPVSSGKLAAVLARGARQECMDAAREVLNGNIILDCLYFRINDGREGIVIGNHVFY